MSKNNKPIVVKPGMPMDPVAALEAVERMVTSVADYAKVVEQEKTKRADIQARRDVALECVRSHREVLLHYMANTFEERRSVLQKQFEVLDKATAHDKDAIVMAALSAIVETVKTPPTQGLQALRGQMQQPGFVLELE